MDLEKLKKIKQNLLLEKEKQTASLYEIIGALKLLDQQILETQESPEEIQPSEKEASKPESKTAST